VVRGKSVVMTFPQPLDSATTYHIQFGLSIQDNNEGNPFGAYSFSFSTGSELDSLSFSGYLVDAQTLLPIANASILLHTNHADTSVYKNLPNALGRTDSWGYFYLPNLKPVPYRVFAIEDPNRNHKLDDNETVAFLDSLFVPVHTITPERLAHILVDPQDTLNMLRRPVEQTLYLFKEKPKRQVLRDKVRPQPRMFFFTFNAPDAHVIDLDVQGVDSLSIVRERSFWGDTLRYWISGNHVPDTIRGTVHYLRTDSLNQLSPYEERFSLNLPREREGQSERKDTLIVELKSKGELVERQGIEFLFSHYPAVFYTDSIILWYATAGEEKVKVPFTFHKDSLDGCRYYLHAQTWIPNTEYTLVVPQNTFKDVYGFANDSLTHQVSIPDPNKFGSITVILEGGAGAYVVDLLSESRDRVVRSLHLKSGETGLFSYLADGKYAIRITEDKNGNGVWDTGNLSIGLQPERVRIYRFSGEADTIEITDKIELEQTIDLDKLFTHDIAPSIPPKTSK